MCAARCVLRACNATLVCAGQAGRPIRTRACAVATAGPAKPVTHAAPRHQHQPPGHRLQHQTGSQRAYRSDGNTIVRPTVRPSVRPFVRSSVRSSVPPFPHRRAFTSTFLLFLAQRPFFSLSLAPFTRRSHLLATGICTIIKPRLLPRLHTHRPGGVFQWTAGKPIGIS